MGAGLIGLGGLGPIQQVTRLGGQAHNPCFAPDGETIAFQSNHEGTVGILAVGRAGSNLRRLTPQGLLARHPAWHPKGAGLAFEVESPQGGSALSFLDFTHGDVCFLTRPGFRDQHPAWFPDGGRLAFHSSRSGGLHLFSADATTGAIEQLSRGEARYKHPAVSPDGNLVACVMSEVQAWTLALIEVPSGRVLLKRTESRLPQHPAFAGGRALVYQDEVGGHTELFRLDLEEVSEVQLTVGAWAHKPAATPDGRWLAFSARVGDAWEICLAPLDLSDTPSGLPS